MKLHGSRTSPFVRKVRIVVEELGLSCPFVAENPRDVGSTAQRLNPLGKVPVLELGDGSALYDSPVIIEYLDSLAPGRIIPSASPARWTALRLQALADGVLESVIRVWLEAMVPEATRRTDFIVWETRRIDRALEALEAEPRFGVPLAATPTVGDIAVGVALEYIDLRRGTGWRTLAPALVAWLSALSKRPSFGSTTLADVP